MKNNIFIYIIFIFAVSLFFGSKALSEDFQFYANEIKTLEKGNKVIAKGGVEIKDKKGVIIKSDEAEYDKALLIIKVKNNVEIQDASNNAILLTNDAIYYSNENKIITKNKTIIQLEEKYTIDTSNITYDRNLKEIFSKNKTIVKDLDNNILSSNNFKLFNEKKIIEAHNVNLIDYELNSYYIELAKLNLKTGEILGKDLSIKFNNKYFEKNNEPRLKARSIIVEKEKTLFSKGTFTTCKKRKDKCPPWEMTAEEIKHDKIKKMINYKNAWLKVYDKPILYFPRFLDIFN